MQIKHLFMIRLGHNKFYLMASFRRVREDNLKIHLLWLLRELFCKSFQDHEYFTINRMYNFCTC